MKGPVSWRGAIVGVLAAGSIGGCVTASGYSGTGVLQISGQPALLTQVFVKLASCAGPPPGASSSESDGPLGGPDEASQSYAVLSIGPACHIEGSSSGVDFRPTAGRTCALDFMEGRRTIRVTSASMRFPRYRASPITEAHSEVEVEVGGQDVATGKFVLFRFTGSAINTDPDPAACSQHSDSPQTASATQ
jgi:hypothetical protein